MKEKLQSIYNALDKVTVSGKQNCAIIAGVMNVIEDLFVEIEENNQHLKKDVNNNGK